MLLLLLLLYYIITLWTSPFPLPMSFSLVLRSIEAALGLVAMAACEAVPDTQAPKIFVSAEDDDMRETVHENTTSLVPYHNQTFVFLSLRMF
jgi:hypothetical protein